jgi:heat shock protein HslJ
MKHPVARLAICLFALIAPGSEWLLVDLAGAAVVTNSEATLSFLDSGKAAGFMGTVTISGNTLKLSPLATTMMAGVDPKLGTQETTYLKALGAASRYEWQAPYLRIYCDGFDKPLRFTRAASPPN